MSERELHPACTPLRAIGTTGVGVLLAHGFTGSPASMRPWADHLIAAGHSVALPLLPGHGTDWREMVPTTWPDWYHAVDRELHWLLKTTERVFVAGLSMGGALALRLAERHPVAGVVLVNPAIATDDPAYRALPLISRFMRSKAAIGNDIAKPGADEHAYPRTPLRPAVSMRKLWADVVANLDRIEAPVLLFTSVTDHVVDAASARILNDRVRDLDQHWLTNSFHVATLDHDAPLIFALTDDFIASRPAGPR